MREPVWIEERETLLLHDRSLALHGGAGGLRDEGLLKSALARPRQHFFYVKRPKIVDLAAIYTTGIIRNHPSIDGNKRTGFIVGVLFLELNGCQFTAPEEDAARAILDLAASAIDEVAYASFLRANSKAGG